jgi:hypothetical protein
MKKNKQYFFNVAILRTIASGLLYLFMPLLAKIYAYYVGYEYVGYTLLGGGILVIFNIVGLCRSWVLAFDSDLRKDYLNQD